MSSQRMGSGPPKVIESLIGVLLPPAYREHVLGDLYERYRSPLQYSADAVRAVASILVGQIIRTWDTRLMLAQAFSLIVNFSAYGFVIGERTELRIGIPVAIALVALMFCDSYFSPKPQRSRAFRDVTISMAVMFGAEMALSLFKPALVLPSLAMNVGGAVAALMLLLIRRSWPSRQSLRTVSGGTARFSPDDLRFRAHQVRQRVISLDFALFFIVLVLGQLGWGIVKKPLLADRMIGTLMIACVVYVVGYRIHHRLTRAVGRDGVETIHAYRKELERLRDDQRRVFSSWGAPIFMAMVAFGVHRFLVRIGQSRPLDGLFVFIFLTVTWAFLLKRTSDQQAQKYQQEIDELDRTKIAGIEQQQ
jgi:hypothetical protein